MQNSTADEAVSLHDALAEAWDQQETGDAPEPEEIAEEPVDEVPEETEEEVEEETEEPEDEEIPAPEHWSAQHKEVFKTLDAPARKFLLERHKEMERAANDKFQEAATARKRNEQLEELIQPFKQQWALNGIGDLDGIRSVLTTYNALLSNPEATLKGLAQQFGISLQQQSSEQEWEDPAIVALRQEIQQLKNEKAKQEAQQTQHAQASLIQQIQTFEKATDETGALKHPHFATVYDDMVRLVQAGIAADLDSAYAKAVALHPELSQAQRNAQAEAEKAAKIAAAKKAQRAKAASAGIRSSVANSVETKPKSVRDELASLYDQLSGVRK